MASEVQAAIRNAKALEDLTARIEESLIKRSTTEENSGGATLDDLLAAVNALGAKIDALTEALQTGKAAKAK